LYEKKKRKALGKKKKTGDKVLKKPKQRKEGNRYWGKGEGSGAKERRKETQEEAPLNYHTGKLRAGGQKKNGRGREGKIFWAAGRNELTFT